MLNHDRLPTSRYRRGPIVRRLGFPCIVVTAVLLALWPSPPMPVTAQGASDGDRLLSGAIDIHLHIDPRTYGADISTLKMAKAKGVRGAVIKNHYEPTGDLALLLRREIPGFEIVGGTDLNFIVGGINLHILEHMGEALKGTAGFRPRPPGAPRTALVWLTTFDSETAVKAAKQNRPFLTVSRNGDLVPELKQAIAVIAKHQLVLATGHNSPAEGLMMVREGRARGVDHMVVTHAMDNPVFMNVEQMREAVALGAFIEFDYRLILTHKEQAAAMRQIGPEHIIVSEFLMPVNNVEPLAYKGIEEAGSFAAGMRALGFSDADLDMMLKRNPARLLGLPELR